jgi:hypothetical protein
MLILASKQLSKHHHNMQVLLVEGDDKKPFAQFTLKGKARTASFIVTFESVPEASDYLDRKKRQDYDAIVQFLINQARK